MSDTFKNGMASVAKFENNDEKAATKISLSTALKGAMVFMVAIAVVLGVVLGSDSTNALENGKAMGFMQKFQMGPSAGGNQHPNGNQPRMEAAGPNTAPRVDANGQPQHEEIIYDANGQQHTIIVQGNPGCCGMYTYIVNIAVSAYCGLSMLTSAIQTFYVCGKGVPCGNSMIVFACAWPLNFLSCQSCAIWHACVCCCPETAASCCCKDCEVSNNF